MHLTGKCSMFLSFTLTGYYSARLPRARGWYDNAFAFPTLYNVRWDSVAKTVQ